MKTRVFLCAALVLAGQAGMAWAKGPAKKPVLAGQCVFSATEIPEKGEPAGADSFKCGDFQNLFIRCYFEKPLGSYDFDMVGGYLATSGMDQITTNETLKTSGGKDFLKHTWIDWSMRAFAFASRDGFSMYYLCDSPRKSAVPEITLKMTAKLYKKTGERMETRQDGNTLVTERFPTYDQGMLVASGSVKIVELPPDASAIDKSGKIEIVYPEAGEARKDWFGKDQDVLRLGYGFPAVSISRSTELQTGLHEWLTFTGFVLDPDRLAEEWRARFKADPVKATTDDIATAINNTRAKKKAKTAVAWVDVLGGPTARDCRFASQPEAKPKSKESGGGSFGSWFGGDAEKPEPPVAWTPTRIAGGVDAMMNTIYCSGVIKVFVTQKDGKAIVLFGDYSLEGNRKTPENGKRYDELIDQCAAAVKLH